MRKIILISYHDSKEINQESYLKPLLDKCVHINSNPLSQEDVAFYIKLYQINTNDLILVHNSQDLNIEGYTVVYFSFGCHACGAYKENGMLLKKIIQASQNANLSQQEIKTYRETLWKLHNNHQRTLEEKEQPNKNQTITLPNKYHLYLPNAISMNSDIKNIFETDKKPVTKEEILTLERSGEFLYLVVPFAGFGFPPITEENSNIEEFDHYYNHYFMELKELQEARHYDIIFLFLSFNSDHIPNFFKKLTQETNGIQKNINRIFLSPLKRFNRDNHLKFLFAEILYHKNDRQPLNFFTLDHLPDQEALDAYLQRDIPYKALKEIYYYSLFFQQSKLSEEKIKSYQKYWNLHKALKYNDHYHENSEDIFHDLDIADMRTSMPFYFPSMINKLHLIKETFQNQTLDFLLIDDEDTLSDKFKEIDLILKTILSTKDQQKLYKLSAKEFNKNNFSKKEKRQLIARNSHEQNIRNTNFILVDFKLDPDGIFFGSDFIERVEKMKKIEDEQFRSWYFITSYLSGYVNKFEIDKIMYEYYDSATVQIGDSTHQKFRIFFIKKLIFFIYSKVNIYIRINKITKKLIDSKDDNLSRKLIELMKTLRQQVDLLELRYSDDNVEKAEQFYALTSSILEDYLHRIYYQWEIKEIKFQQLKGLKDQLSPETNDEIKNLYQLIKHLSFKKGS